MRRLIVTAVLTGSVLLAAAPAALAAGGGGQSYCSLSTRPDGHLIVGDLSTYSNAGEFVSALAPLPGDRGSGWGIQNVCNPNRFGP